MAVDEGRRVDDEAVDDGPERAAVAAIVALYFRRRKQAQAVGAHVFHAEVRLGVVVRDDGHIAFAESSVAA